MIALMLALAIATATPAAAFENMAWQYETVTPIEVSQPARPKKARKRHHVKRATPPPAKVYAYEERPEDGKCYRPLTVVGSQWVGEQGAYDSAVKAMKEIVRWSIGEAAMDPQNWKDVKRRCSMSSVGEVVGQTMHRCELTVVPCRPGLTEGSAQ